MGAVVQTGLVGQILQHLPRSVVSALDAWSHRVARRRAQQRQQKWLERKAAAASRPEQPLA